MLIYSYKQFYCSCFFFFRIVSAAGVSERNFINPTRGKQSEPTRQFVKNKNEKNEK